MSKVDDLLKYFQEHIGEWACSTCGCHSGQPAATFREVKKRGYVFETSSSGRWGKEMFCPVCGINRTFYKLIKLQPDFSQTRSRCTISPKDRQRVLALCEGKDAFTGASISSVAQVDHKIPWTRMKEDLPISSLSDEEVRGHYQLLTGEHNLLKDRACGHCKQCGERPPLFGIRFWYTGDGTYRGTCEGCGWYDGVRWREELNKSLGSSR